MTHDEIKLTDEEIRMTDEEVTAALYLGKETPLNKARQLYHSLHAATEQADSQGGGLLPIEIRRREFYAVKQIAAIFGVRL